MEEEKVRELLCHRVNQCNDLIEILYQEKLQPHGTPEMREIRTAIVEAEKLVMHEAYKNSLDYDLPDEQPSLCFHTSTESAVSALNRGDLAGAISHLKSAHKWLVGKKMPVAMPALERAIELLEKQVDAGKIESL